VRRQPSPNAPLRLALRLQHLQLPRPRLCSQPNSARNQTRPTNRPTKSPLQTAYSTRNQPPQPTKSDEYACTHPAASGNRDRLRQIKSQLDAGCRSSSMQDAVLPPSKSGRTAYRTFRISRKTSFQIFLRAGDFKAAIPRFVSEGNNSGGEHVHFSSSKPCLSVGSAHPAFRPTKPFPCILRRNSTIEPTLRPAQQFTNGISHGSPLPPPAAPHKLVILPDVRVQLDFKASRVNVEGSRAVSVGSRRIRNHVIPSAEFIFLTTCRKSCFWCRIAGIQESCSLS